MTVSNICDVDIPELAKVVNQAYQGVDDSGVEGWTHEKELIAPPRINIANPKEFVLSSNLNVYKFEENGKIFGCVRVERREEKADISILSVIPSGQGKGVGSALLKAAEGWARDKGCETMEMTVVCHRKELQDFYKRRGYKETGETVEFPIRPGYGAPIVPLHFVRFRKPLC